jgi:CxxC motif-containing protein
MKRQFTCIICPNGCEITAEIDANGVITNVEGHTCKKGEEYVQQELTHPVRTIATSVLVKNGELPLVSVRVDGAIPKERIFDAMDEIRKVSLNAPVSIGQCVISNLLGLGVNVIATKNVKSVS